jgi:hypothetical protein
MHALDCSESAIDYLFYGRRRQARHGLQCSHIHVIVLDPRCPDYPAICHSILHGIHDCLSEKYWGYSLYALF